MTNVTWTNMPSQRPATPAEAGECIRQQRSQGGAIYPAGGLAHVAVGYPPLRPGLILDTAAWSQVIDHPARDLTVTVQVGIPVAELQAVLARAGQWLPLDVPLPQRTSLGAAMALNLSGPRRYGYGTLRDYVIGISFLTDEGEEVKGGGRVVKNVAGYDLMKLHIGAMGTLGVITQATLKVRPLPEVSVAVVGVCPSPRLAELLDGLHATATRPVAVEVLSPAAWPSGGEPSGGGVDLPVAAEDWIVVVGFEEKAAAVRWQVQTLREELRRLGLAGEWPELPQPQELWQRLADNPHASAAPWVGKCTVRPSQVAETLRSLQAVATEGVGLQAHGLSGVIWWWGPQPPPEPAMLWRYPQAPPRPLWDRLLPPPTWQFLREVKQALDPHNIFNPGRLFGDL